MTANIIPKLTWKKHHLFLKYTFLIKYYEIIYVCYQWT